MIRKTRGPAPRKTAPSQGVDERERLLPRLRVTRKSYPPARDPSPPHHRRSRRRQDRSWRGFPVRLYCPPTTDGAHALYALLKLAAQRYGLAVGDVREIEGAKEKRL